MGCKMSKRVGRKGKDKTTKKDVQDTTSTLVSEKALPNIEDIEAMKRPALQKLCKQYGLKGSGKNTELIERLQEHINKREVGTPADNNNNAIAQPLPLSASIREQGDGEQCEVENITFDMTDSAIPTNEHVHIGGSSSSVSHTESNIPDSSTEVRVQEDEQGEPEPEARMETVSSEVLRESNKANTDSKSCSAKQNASACTRWCVVEGLLKQDNRSSWRRIHLLGGRPVVSNRYGKRVTFVLEPSRVPTPENCDDNYICGYCVKNNESYSRVQAALRRVTCSSSVMSEEAVDQNLEIQDTLCETPTSSGQSLLTSFKRIGSVKRKRSDDRHAANTSGEAHLLEKKQRKDPASKSGTPASPQVSRARGEQLPLPRNIHNPWRPKKATKTVDKVKEDLDFAKRVEDIIKNTAPGSNEEMCMIMSSKSSRVQRSPTKNTQ